MDEEKYRKEVEQNLRLDKETKEKLAAELNGKPIEQATPSMAADAAEQPYLPGTSDEPANPDRRPAWKRAAPYAGIAAALVLLASAALYLLPGEENGLTPAGTGDAPVSTSSTAPLESVHTTATFSTEPTNGNADLEKSVVAFSMEGPLAIFPPEDAAIISGLLEKGTWHLGAPVCDQDFSFDLSGTVLRYHSDCGTFYNELEGSYLTLDEEGRVQVNAVLERNLPKIGDFPTTTAPENLHTTTTPPLETTTTANSTTMTAPIYPTDEHGFTKDYITAVRIGVDTSDPAVLPETAADMINGLLENENWIPAAPVCLQDYRLKLSRSALPDITWLYHSDCGTFYSETDGRSFTLSETDRVRVNAVLDAIPWVSSTTTVSSIPTVTTHR